MGEQHATTYVGEHAEELRTGDYAQQLRDAIAIGLKQRGKSESVIVGAIRQRAELYEKAFLQAKQAMIRTFETEAGTTERRVLQVQVLRKDDAEVLAPETIGNLAVLDARRYAKLRDPERRIEAALAMADTAHLSGAYRAALAAKAPDVSAAVRTAMAARGKDKEFDVTPVPMPRGELTDAGSTRPMIARDQSSLERVATNRARDANTVTQDPGLNGIEQISERKERGPREPPIEERRAEPKGLQESRTKRTLVRAPRDNQVVSDEVFTAAKDEIKPIFPAEVEDRFLRVGNRFYHLRNTRVVAFEDKGNKLQTQSNSEQIAEVMVTIARARGWDEIKVTGSETFRREVWLEAATHGMHVKGYRPSDVDKAALAQRTMRSEGHRVESGSRGLERASETEVVQTSDAKSPTTDKMAKAVGRPDGQQHEADKRRARAFAERPAGDAILDHPELAGSYAVMTSIKKRATADRLTPQQRAVVIARVESNLVESIERGELPEVKVREQVEVRDERRTDKKVTR